MVDVVEGRFQFTMLDETGRTRIYVFTQDAFTQLQDTTRGIAFGKTVGEALDRLADLEDIDLG